MPRTSKSSRSVRSLILAVTSATALSSAALAQTLTWTGAGLLPTLGGVGQWDTTTPRWWDGLTLQAWNNATPATAQFSGGGLVSVSAPVTANALTFNSSYSLFNPSTSVSTITLAGGTIDTGSNRVDLFNSFAGSNGLTKTGTGALVFYGSQGTSSFSGTININQGTLAFGSANGDLPSTATISIASGAALDLGYFGANINDNVGPLAGSGVVHLGTAQAGGGGITGSILTITSGASGSSTFSGSITGAGGRITKAGAGEQVLSGSNSFTGRVLVNLGTLTFANTNATNQQNTLLFGNGAGTFAQVNFTQPATIGSIGGAETSTISINGDLTIGGDNTRAAWVGAIVGTGKLIKTGTGIQQFTNSTPASTFTGDVVIQNGTLVVSADAKLGNSANAITLDGGVLANWAGGSGTSGSSPNYASRPLSITANGGGIGVFMNDQGIRNSTFNSAVTGAGKLTKYGPGNLAFNATSNTWTGGLVVKEGRITSTANATNGTPFGTGSITVEGGELRVTPTLVTATSSISLLAANGAGANLTYGPGTDLTISRNGNADLSLTVGPAGASSSSLVRSPNGTFTLLPGSGVGGGLGTVAGSLGTTEKLIINGGVSKHPVNGMVSPTIVSYVNSGASAGEYLTYDNTLGFQLATYTTGDINTNPTDNSRVFSTTGTSTLLQDTSVYALQLGKIGVGVTTVSAGTINGAFKLTIGDNSGPAGLLVNGDGQINTSTLAFNGSEAAIYVRDSNTAQINAPLTISGGNGLTKFGRGSISLNQPASYSGKTVIAAGNINIGVNNALPTTTDLVLGGSAISASTVSLAGNNAGIRLNSFTQTVKSLSSTNSLSFVHLGTGTLIVNQDTDTTFKGNLWGTSSGTLVKTGSGKLTLSPFEGATLSNTIGTGTISQYASTYTNLRVSGGTLDFSTFNSLPVTPAAAVADTIVIENGATLRYSGTYAATNTLTDEVAASSLRGVTLGAGGGVIEVVNPIMTLTWRRGDGEVLGTDDRATFNGVGDLIKTGPGYLRLGVGNTYTGRTIVRGGRLQFTTDDVNTATAGLTGGALGAAPGTLTTDGIILDGGGLESAGSGIIHPNRGITVTANGGTLVANNPFVLNSPITGVGALTKNGGDDAQFNAANTFSGGLTITNGGAYFNASDSAGTGSVTLNPTFSIVLGKNAGVADSKLTNAFSIAAGSQVQIRVDGSVGALELAGPVSGASKLFKAAGGSTVTGAGAGTLILSGNNTFTGDLVVRTGTVVAASNNALGATSGVTMVNPGTSLGFKGNLNSSNAEPVYIAGTGVTTEGAISNIAGDNVYLVNVTATQDASIGVNTGSLRVGSVQANAVVSKIGANTLSAQNYLVTTLNVAAGVAKVTASATHNAATGTSKVSALTIDPSAALDLTNNALVVDYTGSSVIGTIQTSLANGYSNGNWGGNGIRSSSAAASSGPRLAIAYGEASSLIGGGGGNWFGQNADATAVVLRYALNADANLDNKVNTLDFNLLAGSFGSSGKTWENGDFNYDGTVDSLDFSALTGNYGYTMPVSSPTAAPSLGSVVPEPATLSVIAISGAALLGRRQRKPV